ncbi:glutathione S-transferase [Pseudoteredinibacter isoporae]|uniref:Glutathione S-transferase n=1 Tax=Pseudoteredinibacter isoporae TaxID=570281 RepID=A0A7X0JYW0_9GAMM|nr:glutathione S-transferase N-terminal domain-containing protein [Pseudoteredinibacter isoporae]MBB6523821.1 glutathione S-transferase [Pseudoteredinibacter isoporae]NHO89341.1 glutathione S-transferase [Pseudoteredinibacter isoporae]NIB22448.1 glutathione S-transferase [Pseudoteredinibacter isoporae]
MQLVVGTDSTWSLRAWICSQIANLDIDLTVIDLTRDNYKAEICKRSKAGQVPFLLDEDIVIHDSLAIAEYFNEISDGAVFPVSSSERALARSLCAELHSGFMQLRSRCPFTLKATEPLQQFDNGIQTEIDRLASIFESANGPFMFSRASAVDAFYSILAFRLQSYGIKLDGKAGEYQQNLLNWDLLNAAIHQAQRWNQSTNT